MRPLPVPGLAGRIAYRPISGPHMQLSSSTNSSTYSSTKPQGNRPSQASWKSQHLQQHRTSVFPWFFKDFLAPNALHCNA